MKGRYQLKTEEDAEEGFDYPHNDSEQFVLHSRIMELEPQSLHSLQPALRKPKLKSSQRHVLKLDSLQSTNLNLSTLSRHSKAASLLHARLDDRDLARIEEAENRSLIIKHRKINRERSLDRMPEEEEFAIFRRKREIGEDLVLRHTAEQDAQPNQVGRQVPTLVYSHRMPASTHAFFRRMAGTEGCSFLDHKYNALLRHKIDKFKQKPDEKPKIKRDLEFRSDFESANLQQAHQIATNQYNLFLRIDTHTNGHQNWFYFKVINHQHAQRTIRLNICNLKRKFKMIEKGQKIFICRNGEWKALEEALEVEALQRKIYQLSFSLTLPPNDSVLIALIPPYTYTQLLEDMAEADKSPNAKVEVLTYTVSGLAIPMITITKNAKREWRSQSIAKRKLYLISGRIHPSETCSSYLISGLLSALLAGTPDTDQFLASAVVKIIPMLNPDGVVFGNFRTSYLGDDLNRSFHQSDEAIYPETSALKQLARLCKDEFGDNLLAFIDMHGHSGRPNAFVYGPEYEEGSEQFVQCRIFPKILDKVSRYFSYELSSFRLEQYKSNTARGHFLRKFKIPSYTIEASYALFQEKQAHQSGFKAMGIQEWKELGGEIAEALSIYTQYVGNAKNSSTQFMLRKKPRMNQSALLKRNQRGVSFADVHSEIRKQIALQRMAKPSEEGSSSESDGEPAEQDLPAKLKEALVRSVREVFQVSYLGARAMKPTMILPAIVPSIVLVSKKERRALNMIIPKHSSKMRQKKFARPLNYNSEFNEYLLKNNKNISSLRPDIINFNSIIARKLKEAEAREKR